jgi:hypothetical protein
MIEDLFEKLPNGPMKDSLQEQDVIFAAEMAQRYIEADPETKNDILDFFEYDGPRRVHEARLKVIENIPTSDDLETNFS